MSDWFYKPVWKKENVSAVDAGDEKQTWLVFKDNLGLADALIPKLKGGGHRVISVSVGDQFQRGNDDAYTINPRARIDYDTLTADLVSQHKLPTRIAHFWLVNEAEKGEARMRSYYRNQDLGFYSLFFLAQTLGEEDLPAPLHTMVFVNGVQCVNGEAVPYPEKATVFGPIKVIPQEMPGMTCAAVDLALPPLHRGTLTTTDAALLAQQILAELQAGHNTRQPVAYRQGVRYVQGYEPARHGPVEGIPQRLKPGGVYFITGGLGGIGLVMAEHLAETVQARLALVNRSALPPRAEWASWLETHGEFDRTSRRIRKVQALEAAGADVLVLAADVTNREQMTQAVAQTRKHFGTIHGVIHAAGVLDDGLIQLKSPQDADKVLSPKVRGALLLDELLASDNLDFFVLFSSTSTALGAAGQIDYVGANAFLNAFAESKMAASAAGPLTVAVNWGVWQEVGMAMEAAVQLGLVERPSIGENVPHPLLDQCIIDDEDEIIYATEYSVEKHWLLDQHRIKGGSALIPGTGYLEIAKAAVTKGVPNGAVAIQELFFIAPLEVADDEKKEVRVTLAKDGHEYALTVTTKEGGAPPVWREHARARVAKVNPAAPTAQNIQNILARCTAREESYQAMQQETQQEKLYLDFGPRWKVLRQVHFGENEALALLILPEQYTADLAQYTIHPAMMDLATSFAMPLIPGYEGGDDFYVPLSYKRVQIYAALPQRIYSHVRFHAHGSPEVPTFDVTIMGEDGRVLVEITEFTLKRVSHQAMVMQSSRRGAGVQKGGGETAVSQSEPTLLQLALTEGILPAEGAEALSRILANGTPPQIIVSSLDLQALIDEIQHDGDEKDAFAVKVSRPELESSYEGPRNDVERMLSKFWEDLLGIDEIGIHDDFFELGGHSLIAVRLFNKVKKQYGVDLSLATLFEAPTIAQFAELLGEYGVELKDSEGTAVAATDTPPAERTRRRGEWSALVPVQPKGHKPPFFCVHGGFGNVLIFYDLARYLGQDQPFYGLQAQGVDGRQRALRTIANMARVYVQELRAFQPQGPYYIGGFSMGGAVAFEMAQILQRDGQDVGLVVLFDTYNPWRIAAPAQPTELKDKMGQHRDQLASMGLGARLQYLSKWSVDKFKRTRKKLRDASLNTVCHLYIKSGRVVPQRFRDPYMWQATLQATNNYVPQLYPGKVTLFRASESLKWNPVESPSSWRQVAGDGLDVRLIEGTHDIIKEPYVNDLARQFKEVLDQAQQGRSIPK
ncbi:MAG: SDR family NAD(P)-dependent oxidoreductase [Chloroflexota bacterium]